MAAWGDVARKVKLSSIRKSLLCALYGRPVIDGRVNLDATLEDLGIDDDPPLIKNEKRATLQMLFQSRSGVYHSYVGGTPDMRARMPARELHLPGTFWYYNNWDFNVLGGIYERKLSKKIGEAFEAEIAAPIQMQDFRIEDMYYVHSPDSAEAFAKSMYPAYHFRLTAEIWRDSVIFFYGRGIGTGRRSSRTIGLRGAQLHTRTLQDLAKVSVMAICGGCTGMVLTSAQ